MAKQLVWGAVLSAVLLLLCLRFQRSLDDRLIASLGEPSRLVVQSSSPKSSSKPTPTLDQSPHHSFLRKLGVDDHGGDGGDVHNGKVLYVHIVPHTHDDVGWRKTVEQYYYGLNNSIDTRGSVHSIITTAVESLLDDPARTFTYVEMKFLSIWWKSQSDQMKDNVRYLIANKQLSIVNGGWCMHDEAAPHYIGMIDQTSLGHEFLTRELGVIPKVGWQLDPFGHSATQASLMSRGMGFDALYFGRIDYQDLRLRQLTRQCEGLWNASRESSDIASPIFWGLTGSYGGNYGAPRGYCFDVLCQDEPLVGANETRLRERLRTFLEDVRIQSDRTQGDHVMVTMGEDFNYIQAHLNFANMDLLINSIMSYQHWKILDIPSIFGPQYDRVDIFYSTPDYYTEMKYKETVRVRNRPRTMQRGTSNSAVGQQGQHVSESPVWVVKTDDFFPYSDCEHCFWTGYFTSRASFKRFERVSSSFLLAARQIEALWSGQSNSTGQGMESRPLFALEDALGIAQHHDAVSGTAKQHVADDYSFKLQTGLDLASKFVAKTLKNTLISDSGLLENLTFCHQLNESICDLSQDATKSLGKDLYVVVYNAKASEVSSIIRLPVSTNQTYLVERVERNATVARSRLVETVQAVNLRTTDKPRYTVMFDTGPLPPIGVALFRVSMTNKVFSSSLRSNDLTETRRLFRAADGKDVVVSNELLSVTFDSSTGMMKQVFSQNVSLLLTQEWGYYTSFDSDYDRTEVPSSRADQNSGAYVFRPSTPEEKLKLMNASPSGAKFVDTSVGTEVHVSFDAPWIRQVTRILKGQPYVEIEYTIGPIPIDDGRGREIVNRYITPIKSEGKVYTDSNGREFLERRRNYRPSWSLEVYEQVAGNYYPINAAAYIEDSDAALSVVVDRSQGGGSIIDGTLEFMVQRRTVADDFRGVDEPLNETCGGMEPYPPYGDAKRVGDGVVIRGVHRLLVGAKGAGLARSQMDATFAEPLIFVASSPKPSTPVGALVATQSSLSALQLSLPSNVMLITLMRLQDRERPTWLLRLGHQYAAGEHEVLSQPAKVNLATFLVDWDVSKIEEKTLSGNRDWDVYTKERYDWTGELDASETTDAPIDSIVVLQPMQIRTFEITVTAKT